MSDSKIRILQRLEAGEITAEEAMSMMNQLNESPAPPPSSHHPGPGQVDPRQIDPRKSKGYQSHQSFDYDTHSDASNWLDNLLGWVGETVEDIAGSIKDSDVSVNLSDIISGTYGHYKHTESFVSKPILQGLTQLDINGKNDKVEIYAYDGDCVQIHCDYDARRPESYVEFHDENGHVALWFDDKSMRSVRVICHVPREHIGHIHAVTKNGRIQLVDITAGDINLSTKNDGILLESINCSSLTATTRNDNIKAMAITGESILLETTNSKITAADIHATSLTLKTSNAGIKTANLDVTHLALKTTNARLKIEDTLLNTAAFWENERSLDAYTTNGGVRLSVPRGIGLAAEARTTDGKVTSEVPLYGSEGSTKNHLVGESMDYATASRRLRVRLGTTNASVKIFEV